MDARLSEELQRVVQAQVQSGRYGSEEGVLRDVRDWLREQERHHPSASGSSVEEARTVDEMIDRMTADVPEHEWTTLPTDGAEQHDH